MFSAKSPVFLIAMTLALAAVSQAQLANTKITFVSERDGNREIYVMNADGTNVMRLTNHPANDTTPAWSPDGTKIVFTSERDGNSEIYVMNADGTNVMRLTNHPAQDGSPAWSPDGMHIAFDSDRDNPGAGEIYAMNADGTNVTRLTNNHNSGVGAYQPVWSPDGTKILFRSRPPNTFCCSLYLMNADGSNQTRLTFGDDNGASWSPDGTKIAFARESPRDIYVMNADGTNVTRLTNNPISDDPSWSPDGTKLVLTSNRAGNYEIYVMNADGTNVTRLTNNAANDYQPVWSPLLHPVCDIQLNKSTFVNGNQVIAQVARLANPGPTPVPVEVKLWFELPGNQPPFPFLTVGADGLFVLAPGFDHDFGPLSLATVQPTYLRGPYQFNCRLLHAVTGAPLAEDFNPFQLQ